MLIELTNVQQYIQLSVSSNVDNKIIISLVVIFLWRLSAITPILYDFWSIIATSVIGWAQMNDQLDLRILG